MSKEVTNIYLEEGDFDDISVEDVKCKGCNGPLCSDKTPKMYKGELVFVCHLGEKGRTVLERAANRRCAD